jgi:hypothetical protein
MPKEPATPAGTPRRAARNRLCPFFSMELTASAERAANHHQSIRRRNAAEGESP